VRNCSIFILDYSNLECTYYGVSDWYHTSLRLQLRTFEPRSKMPAVWGVFCLPKMTGSRYLAESLHAYGVSHVFFVPAVALQAMAEMEDFGIRRVMTHGEKAAAYMADGFARASRRPGICLPRISAPRISRPVCVMPIWRARR
jgi:hypothetical protein